MLVDDDPDVERTLTRVLEIGGYRVVSASTAADARALLAEVHPDSSSSILYCLMRTVSF